jgi:hypothetical protein
MSKSSNRFWSAIVAVASLYLGPVATGAAALFRVVSVSTTVYAFMESRRIRRNGPERTRQPEVTQKSPVLPRTRIYGEARVGGAIGYAMPADSLLAMRVDLE